MVLDEKYQLHKSTLSSPSAAGIRKRQWSVSLFVVVDKRLFSNNCHIIRVAMRSETIQSSAVEHIYWCVDERVDRDFDVGKRGGSESWSRNIFIVLF